MLSSCIQQEIIQQFRVQKKDVSSLDIQIGLLSEEIANCEEAIRRENFSSNKSFFLKRLHLIKLIAKRRKHLNLLFVTATHRYYKLIKQLNIDF